MIYYDFLLAILLFFATIPVWIFLYKHYLGGILADIYVQKIESGQIDLNYLLDEGGVFEELTDRIVKRFKLNMLAEIGQLSNQSKGAALSAGGLEDPVSSGLEISGMILNQLGMKKPPAMLQYKLANVLGNLMDQQAAPEDDGVGRFYPDRP